jgi:hypothetical protein
LRGIEVGQRGVQRGFGNKALVDQRLVVVVLALHHVDLRLGGLGLFFGLAHARLVFGGVDARDHLAGLDHVAFAHGQPLQFTGHAGLDDGGVDGLERARNRQALDDFAPGP